MNEKSSVVHAARIVQEGRAKRGQTSALENGEELDNFFIEPLFGTASIDQHQ